MKILNFRYCGMCSPSFGSVYFHFFIFKKRTLIRFKFARKLPNEKTQLSCDRDLSFPIRKVSKSFTRNDVCFNFIRALQRQTSRCAWRIFNAMTLITTPSRLIIWPLGVSMLNFWFYQGPLDRRTKTTTSTRFLFWARTRNMSVSKPYAHAQFGKLVLVLVLVLRSKGP